MSKLFALAQAHMGTLVVPGVPGLKRRRVVASAVPTSGLLRPVAALADLRRCFNNGQDGRIIDEETSGRWTKLSSKALVSKAEFNVRPSKRRRTYLA